MDISLGPRGLTLIELLIVLAILAVLLAVTPAIGHQISRYRATTQMLEFYRLIQYARSAAIFQNREITLCGSHDGSQCDRDWHAPEILVFYDTNHDKTLDSGDTLLRRERFTRGKWHWRGSAGRDYLRFRRDGSAIEWGRFTQCPLHESAKTASQLVLNRVGRAYLTQLHPDEIQAEGLCI